MSSPQQTCIGCYKKFKSKTTYTNHINTCLLLQIEILKYENNEYKDLVLNFTEDKLIAIQNKIKQQEEYDKKCTELKQKQINDYIKTKMITEQKQDNDIFN